MCPGNQKTQMAAGQPKTHSPVLDENQPGLFSFPLAFAGLEAFGEHTCFLMDCKTAVMQSVRKEDEEGGKSVTPSPSLP